MKRVLALTLWLVASGSIHTLPNLVYASTGDLDPFFGVNGKASTHISGTDTDEGNTVVLQPDGKIIVAGQTFSAATSLYHLALVRYNSDGTLDQTFGSAGTVVGNFPNRTEQALAVVLQSDGKIVVAGQTKLTSNANSGDFLLARYNSNGTLDNSFGSGGMVATDFNGTNDEARAVVVQANGRILVAGSGGTSNSFALARYNSTGALDTSFSGSGKATLTFGGYNGGASALALQTDGKIVVAGTGSFGALPDFAVARLTEDGNPDFSFGFFSVVTSDFSGDGTSSSSDSAQALAIQSDGKIVLAGRGHNTFALARYNTNGSVDTTFGNTGKVVGLPLSDNSSGGATGLAIQVDGRIVAGGSVLNVSGNGTSDFALARYNTNGGLDQSFGTNGVTIADISGNTLDDFANALQLQPDGKVVLAGTVVKDASNQQRDFAVARFQGGSSNQNCLFTITQFARTFQQSGGTASVAVTTSGGCNWAAQSNATWLTITSGAIGTGNGTVSYTVAANSTTSSRSGTMNIAGQTFTVTQNGATSASPTVQFSAATYSVNEDGNSAAITVTRSGNTSGAVAVNYATSDTAGLTNCNVTGTGIASSRCDYATSIGTLRF
ncbi:MAG: hypothetical protein QOH63_3589, partial [Acidobacteriota bacterium]|nr:hypothetical protein [Acidobacteriota bacterium]